MYFITFTRKMGADGSEIAKRVAEGLQYNFYDTEAIENAAREMGFLQDIKDVDDKAPTLFQRLFSHRPEIHLDRLHSVIYELASRGSAVFLGRGSHILLKQLGCALHVRIVASTKKRLENLARRGVGADVALKLIRRSDHERAAFIKFAFGVDWEDPGLYDIVLNMDNLSLDLAVDTVLYLARSEEIKARSVDAMKSLGMMGLTRRAEAALIEAGFVSPSLSVSVVEPGRVQLTGTIAERLDRTKAVEVLKRVKGVEAVDDQVRVLDHHRSV